MFKQENVVEIKDEDIRRTEAARLRQRVEKYMLACLDLDEDLLPAFYVRTAHSSLEHSLYNFSSVSILFCQPH
jgi:hypothetical protein